MSKRKRSPSNTMMKDVNTKSVPEQDYDMQAEEMNLLDKQEAAERGNIYANNKIIFLLQSTLLGLSYAMVWPTLWTYIRDEFNMDLVYTKFIFSMAYVAYPIASMLSAYLVKNTKISTRKTIFLLNSFEIIGNLVYTFTYFPGLPVLGRFIAGLGDAFYVVLMKEMKQRNARNEKMTMECLAAFILGVILAPGLNIVSTFLHFSLGSWHLNSNNYPGLTLSLLFLLMQFVIFFFLSDPNSADIQTRDISEDESRFPFDPVCVIKESNYKSALITFYSFTYTYIVASFELMIPLIIYEIIQTNDIGAMLLYAVIGTLYGMFLMMTMTVSFDHQLEMFIGISSVVQIAGLFSLIYFQELNQPNTTSTLCMIVVVLALTIMWSTDDVLFINFVQSMIAPSKREVTHSLRKSVSRFAFGLAGITVPFWFSNAVFIVGPILIFLVAFLLVSFIIIRVAEKSVE